MITAYFRDVGPICYTAPLFGDSDIDTDVPKALLQSGLSWYWESNRKDPKDLSYNNPDLPPIRPLTALTEDNIALFLADLQERNADDFGRTVVV